MKRVLALAVILAACKGERPKVVPDAAPVAAAASPSLLGGLDPMQLLDSVRQNLGKPGPYEPPEASTDYDPHQPHFVVLNLSGAITEVDTLSPLGGGTIELRALTDRLHGLAGDDNVLGVIVRVGDLRISLTQATELRAAIAAVHAAGKPVDCHAESADNATYLVLAACGKIGLAPLGELTISGPAAMPIHIKGLLDKLGVTADFLHVGAYKGAAEPLTRDDPSPEMKETLDAILDQAYDAMVQMISTSRSMSPVTVKAAIDQAEFTADDALGAHLVDTVGAWDAFLGDEVKSAPWVRISVEEDRDATAQMLRAARFLGLMPASRPTGEHLALVYAVGDIVDGSGDGLLGARTEIASGAMVSALETLAADKDVKAVVLRIDSPGGSARASELIWEVVHELAGTKPVIVSMGDVAASGGYYIASAATKIYALPGTLTGSIGVVGGKLAPAQGLADLGIKAYPMGRGKRATMMRSLDAWTPDERDAVQKNMEEVYTGFVMRVATGRKMSQDAVAQVAAGRVWTGAKAQSLGLVDELGTLDDAITEAEQIGGLPSDTEIEVYPPTPTLRDYLVKFGAVELPWGMGAAMAELARTVSPDLAAVVEHTLYQLVSFRDAQIQAVSILPLDLR